MEKFQLHDQVEWTSQSAGSWTIKRGRVVCVVPPGINPDMMEFVWTWDGGIRLGGGRPRKDESYLVEVNVGAGWQHLLYWPRVSALERIT